MDDDLIALLRCPVSGQPLRRLTPEEKQSRGIPADEEALASADGARVYRAVSGFPSLLPPAKDEVSGG